MEKNGWNRVATFACAAFVGCGAAIAIASATAASVAAPSLRAAPVAPTTEVVRLEPVVVTVSKSTFERVRAETNALDTAVARNADGKVTRG